MPIFKLSSTQNNASVKWPYFAQKSIKIHLQPSRFDKFSWRRNPDPCYRGGKGKGRGGKGIKGFLLLKEGEGGKDKREARRGGVIKRE